MKFRMMIAAVMAVALSACSYVGPGEEGVRVTTVGSERGVDGPLPQGYYYTGFTSSVYSFPTFTQNYNWDKSNNEEFTFSDKGGLSVDTAIGISYHVEPGKVKELFLKYRKGIDEITNVYLHNMVRDALIEEGSKHPIEYIYGEGRPIILADVQKAVQLQVEPIGIVIEKINWIGKLNLPQTVTDSINTKIQANQLAQQRQNEIVTAQAEAAKVAAAAQGEADKIRIQAEAQAKANKILSDSITGELVEYKRIEKWDGKLPTYQGGGAAMMFQAK